MFLEKLYSDPSAPVSLGGLKYMKRKDKDEKHSSATNNVLFTFSIVEENTIEVLLVQGLPFEEVMEDHMIQGAGALRTRIEMVTMKK